ncbi:unnamed protein product, partial [marine sediment metagenome]
GASPYTVSANGQSAAFTSIPSIRGAGFNDSPIEFIFSDMSGNGLITDGSEAGTSTNITDATYTGNSLGFPASLNGRFYLAANTAPHDEFFASDALDGQTYGALAFASADESIGDVLGLIPAKSALYALTSRSIEYWQTFDDATFPLRRVKGASLDAGVLPPDTVFNASNVVDVLYDTIGFLGYDSKVYLIEGGVLRRISDIDLAVKTDGDKNTISFCHFI